MQALRRFLQDISGVAAIEFALIAPLLCAALLAAVDLGAVLGERQALDHVLRAGAQGAMADRGSASVLATMQTVATDAFPAGGITLSADRFCACPSSPGNATACGTICAQSQPTLIFYRLAALRQFHGSVYPRFDFAPVLQVQVR